MAKQCAVCGDTCSTNVRLAWRRDRDGKTVNVCMACAESHKVNENSIDNFTGKATLYVPVENSTKTQSGNKCSMHYMGKTHMGVRGRVRKQSTT